MNYGKSSLNMLRYFYPLGRTALIQAAQQGHADTASLLLEKGASVNMADEKGTSTFILQYTDKTTQYSQLRI